MSILYKLTSPSGKSYIGRHRHNEPQRRFDQHVMSWNRWVRAGRPRKAYTTKLFYAFDKYPPETWNLSVLERCKEIVLGDREAHYIKEYNSIDDGYNLTAGGGLSKLVLSVDHKAKQSITRKAYYETNAGIAWRAMLKDRFTTNNPCKPGNLPWNTGKELSEEHKQAISVGGKGKKRAPRSAEWSKNISDAKKGMVWSEEHKRSMSESQMGHAPSDVQRKAVTVANQKEWIVTAPSGAIRRVVNLNQFCRENNLHQSNLSRGGHRGWKARKYQA